MVAAGLLAVSSGAYASQGLWRPQIGDGSASAPAATAAAPSAPLLKSFAVLRRDQTSDDRSASAAYALRFAGSDVESVNTNYVRVLGKNHEGQPIVLISQTSKADGEQLCLWVQSPQYAGGQACNTVQRVLDGGLVLGRGTDDGSLAIVGVVPDGAATVQVGEVPRREPVANNLFQTIAGEDELGSLELRTYDADGDALGGLAPHDVNENRTPEQEEALRRHLSRYMIGDEQPAIEYVDVAYSLCPLIGASPRPTQTQLEDQTIQKYEAAGVRGFDRQNAAQMLEVTRLTFCLRRDTQRR